MLYHIISHMLHGAGIFTYKTWSLLGVKVGKYTSSMEHWGLYLSYVDAQILVLPEGNSHPLINAGVGKCPILGILDLTL